MLDKIIIKLERKRLFFLATLFTILIKEGAGAKIVSSIIPAYNIYKYNEFGLIYYSKTSWEYDVMLYVPVVYICLTIFLVISHFLLYITNKSCE